MKLAFWEYGMPDWSREDIARHAADLGYQGVDVRVGPRDGSPVHGVGLSLESSAQERASIKSTFAKAGVELASLLCPLRGPAGESAAAWSSFEAEIVDYAELAKDVGADRIMLSGGVGNPPAGETWEHFLAEVWRSVGSALDEIRDVRVTFFNHRGLAGARQLLAARAASEDPRIGIAFGPDHAVVMQENILILLDEYGPLIEKVCFADRRAVHDNDFAFDGRFYYVKYEACLYGEGLVPAERMLSALTDAGFDGYVSLKWEKSPTTNHHLPPIEAVLAGFPTFIRQYGGGSSRASSAEALPTAAPPT